MTADARTTDPWPTVSSDVLANAREHCLEALSPAGHKPVGPRLAKYYNIDGNYVGRSFAALLPNDADSITPADLHATSLLSVEVGPQATRRLLEPGPARDGVHDALRRVPLVALADAKDDSLDAVADFYRAVKAAISSSASKDPNPWVTASKLCARKRPGLFPVRDNNVCKLLGIRRLGDFRADIVVFRSLVQDPNVQMAVQALPGHAYAAAEGRQLHLDAHGLRLLDAALWTYTIG